MVVADCRRGASFEEQGLEAFSNSPDLLYWTQSPSHWDTVTGASSP